MVLTLYGNITRLEDTNPLCALQLRQLAMKEEKSKSWFIYAQSVASRYSINLAQLVSSPWSKADWKRYITQTIGDYWYLWLLDNSTNKSSTATLLPGFLHSRGPHPL